MDRSTTYNMNKVKSEAEFKRALLQDTPPRKRQARKSSTVREGCALGYDLPQLPAAADVKPQPLGAAKDEPPSPYASEPEFNIADMEFIIVGQETEVETQPFISPPTTPHKTSLSVTHKNSGTILDDWMTANDSDVDLDIDLDDDACPLPMMRNAANEPACECDMTEFATQVLQTEDNLNDRVLLDIAPNDDFYHFEWNRDGENFTGRRESFTEPSGPTFDLTRMTPSDIFYKMFDSQFIDRLCRETNRYAEQKIASLKEQKKLLPTSRLHRWTPTDCDEMISFLAILILQGLYPVPDEEKYFSFNGFGTMPYFSRIMSYNRFALLKSLYHFVDNQTTTDAGKLYKIQPVLDYLNEKFTTLYIPSQEIVIDESLLKWYGRLSFSQKIATKAAHVGIKTYELCESHTGYLWKFIVYAGKKTETGLTAQAADNTLDQPGDVIVERPDDESVYRFDNEAMDPGGDEVNRPQDEIVDGPDGSVPRPTNATATIVLELIEPLLHRGHTLIMDNFYNSPLLLRWLKRHKTDCYGTLRLNRKFVPDSLKTLQKTDLKQGEVVTRYSSDLSVIVWRDANLVSMISTYHHLKMGVQNKNHRLTYKPQVVLDYNKSMGGVDRKDQFLSAQPVERTRNKIWYKKVFCRLLSTAVFNAFVIFSTAKQKMSHREFRTIMVEDLLKKHRRIDLTTEPRLYVDKTRQLAIRTNDSPAVHHDHFPERSTFKQARCYMCTRRKRNTRTIWKCIQCNVSLCIEHCFRQYHKTMLH